MTDNTAIVKEYFGKYKEEPSKYVPVDEVRLYRTGVGKDMCDIRGVVVWSITERGKTFYITIDNRIFYFEMCQYGDHRITFILHDSQDLVNSNYLSLTTDRFVIEPCGTFNEGVDLFEHSAQDLDFSFVADGHRFVTLCRRILHRLLIDVCGLDVVIAEPRGPIPLPLGEVPVRPIIR